MNVYSIYNQELNRMHELLKWYLTLPENPPSNQYSGYYTSTSASGTSPGRDPHRISKIYERILYLQDSLMDAIKNSDTLIQEKVAELALTDTK